MPSDTITLAGCLVFHVTEFIRELIVAARDLSGVDYVYLWADGIHVNIRLEEHLLCLLVMIGVRSGATFIYGQLVERPDEHPQSEAA